MSAQGPDLQAGPWGHSILEEHSFVCPALAQLLALQQEFSIRTEDHPIFDLLWDTRPDDVQPEAPACFWSLPSAGGADTFRPDSKELGSPAQGAYAEMMPYQTPALHMADKQAVETRENIISARAPQDGANGPPGRVYSRCGSLDVQLVGRRSILHTCPHSLPLTVSFELSTIDRASNRWHRQFNQLCSSVWGNSCRAKLPLGDRSLSQPVQEFPSTAPDHLHSWPTHTCLVLSRLARTVSDPATPAITTWCPKLRPLSQHVREFPSTAKDHLIPPPVDRLTEGTSEVLGDSFCWAHNQGRNAFACASHSFLDFWAHNQCYRWPANLPPLPEVGQVPAKTRIPKAPTDLQHVVASQARILPEELRWPLTAQLIGELHAYTPAPAPDDEGCSTYTVFDPLRHFRSRRAHQSWSLADYVADAVFSLGRPARIALVLAKPIEGFAVPQIVLTPYDAARDHVALPFDFRSFGRGVLTLEARAGMTANDAWGAASEHGLLGRQAARPEVADEFHMTEASSRPVQALQLPLHEHQWLRLVRGGFPQRQADLTTVTTTAMRAQEPPMLLGQLQGILGVSTDLPRKLQEVALCPSSLREAYSALLPAAQLRLFPELDPACRTPKTIPFTVHVHGHPPLRAQGNSLWSLIDFCSAAADFVEGGRLRRVQLLTVGLPGLPGPQLTITQGESPDEHTVLPIDMRGIGHGILPIMLSPGMNPDDVFQAAIQELPSLRQILDDPLYASTLYLQDAQGQVYDSLPAHLTALQWLAIRRQPISEVMAETEALLTSTSTTSTQAVAAEPEVVSFILVGEGITLRRVPEMITQADPQEAVIDLVDSMTRMGRFSQGASLRMAPVIPRTSRATLFVIPLLVVPPTNDVVIFLDPGVDGSQVHALHLEPGTWPEDLLTVCQRRRGIRLYINGGHSAVCRRPLVTGDMVQQIPAGHHTGVARHAGYALAAINRLRCLTMPLAIPAMRMYIHGGVQGPFVAPAQGTASLRTVVERIFEDRVEVLGRPARTSKLLFILQEGHAPHHIWVETPLTPDVREAVALLEQTGLFHDDTSLVSAASEAEAIGGDVFLAVPTNAPYATLTVTDPASVLQYLLVHLPPDGTPPIAMLPLRPGFAFVTPFPSPLANGMHLHSRRLSAAASRPPSRSASGTSLLQLSTALIRHGPAGDSEQVDKQAEVVAASRPTTLSIATPFGRRTIASNPTGGSSLLQGPVDTPALPATVTSMLNQTEQIGHGRTCLSLDQCLPTQTEGRKQMLPDRSVQLRCGVTPDMYDMLFEPFGLSCLQPEWCQVPDVKRCSKKFLHLLPTVDRSKPLEALQCYVDGSFFDQQPEPQAGFAIAVIALQQRQWTWAGFLSVHCPCQGSVGTLGVRVGSSFETEVAAIVHAMAIACAIPVPTLIAYDNLAAGQIASGQAVAQEQTALTAAACSLFHLLQSAQREPAFLHVRSHEGNPLNEFVDTTAKLAAKGQTHGILPHTLHDAVQDEVLPWLWMALGLHPSFPQLSESGVLLDRVTGHPGPALSDMLPHHSVSGQLHLQLRAVSYNCLSAATIAQREALSSQFLKRGASIVGLQESRGTGPARQHSRDYHIFASDSHLGQDGCQLWFVRHQAVGWIAETPVHWDPSGFSVVMREPSILVVLARLGSMRVGVICAHAPTSKSPVKDRKAWWNKLDRAFKMLPVNCVPLMLIDANAQMATAKPAEDSNVALFGSFLERHELLHTKARDDNGDEICTWQSPNGLRICIDYVVLPLALSEAIQGQGVFSQFRGLVDHDHRPVWADIVLRREASSRVRTAPLDYNFLRTDKGRTQLAHMLQAIPPIPWETGVDEHLHQIHQHITQGLAAICPKRPSHARGKVTSEGTWDLIRARRQLRRELHAQRQTSRLEELAPLFAAWKGRAAEASANLHLQRLHASLIAIQIRGLSKLITRSARQDAAHAAKATFAEARRAGPEALSRLFRSILKTGRRYRAPHVAPAIIKEGKVVENSIAAIGDHFAAAERAQLTPGEQIRNPRPTEEETALQVCEAFSIPSIAHAFGNLATRKAAGISGIPAEVYSLAPIQAANCHLPLITKLQTRRQVPLLWKGGKAVPIEKPHKNLALPSGWRSILLVEAGAKGLGRAMRQCLLRGYEQLRVEGQGGSRPKAPMQVAMGLIRGFVAELQAKRKSGGVVFIDGQAAFYSTIRQALVGRDGFDSMEGLRRLSEVLFQTEKERPQFISTALAPGLMEASGVPIEVRRVVAASLDRTWFGVGDSCELTYSTLTGTTPGAPLADLAFQYIFSTTLRQLQSILKDIDCRAFVGDGAEIQVPPLLPPPTWMDDLAVPFSSSSAQAVVPTAKPFPRSWRELASLSIPVPANRSSCPFSTDQAPEPKEDNGVPMLSRSSLPPWQGALLQRYTSPRPTSTSGRLWMSKLATERTSAGADCLRGSSCGRSCACCATSFLLPKKRQTSCSPCQLPGLNMDADCGGYSGRKTAHFSMPPSLRYSFLLWGVIRR